MLEKLCNYFGTSEEFETGKSKAYTVAGLRVFMGWMFLYLGVDKIASHGLTYSYATTYLTQSSSH